MVWNKTPEAVVKEIQRLLHNFNLRYADISDITGVAVHTVCQVNSKMPAEFKALRYSGINRAAKLKSNPMTGKKGLLHHNAVDRPIRCGHYWSTWAPTWWTGKTDNGRAYLHQVVWAEHNGVTEVPHGHVIHHKDHNKDNNSPDNLELLSRKDHALHHAADNFWKSATTRAEARREQCSRSAEHPNG